MQLKYLLRVTTPRLLIGKRNYAAEAMGTGTQGESKATTAPPPPGSRSRNPSMQMQGWAIHGYGQVEELQLSQSLKMPQIRQANECLVRVHATSVNPIDVAMLGGYGSTVFNAMRCQPGSIEFPLTLGREFCGELVQRGMRVTDSHVALGERVWGVVPLQTNGAHAEYVVVPDYCLSSAPSNLSNTEAAGVLYAGLTAWSGLYVTGLLGGIQGAVTASGGGAFKRVLVLGGAGGVGSLAIQLLKAQNAEVLATCSENALELVRGLGADVVVDYKNTVEHETLRSCGPYDIILDCAGQGADYAKNLDLEFKQYITFSSPLLRNIDSSGVALGLMKNVADLVESNARVLSKQCGLVKWGFFAPAPQGIQLLKRLVERQKILPVIDGCYKFAQLPEAFQRVKDGHLRGKVVVDFKPDEAVTESANNTN